MAIVKALGVRLAVLPEMLSRPANIA